MWWSDFGEFVVYGGGKECGSRNFECGMRGVHGSWPKMKRVLGTHPTNAVVKAAIIFINI